MLIARTWLVESRQTIPTYVHIAAQALDVVAAAVFLNRSLTARTLLDTILPHKFVICLRVQGVLVFWTSHSFMENRLATGAD